MTRRLNGWDYTQRAIYSITVTLADRSREWLGHLAKNGEAPDAPGTVPGPVPRHSWRGLGRGLRGSWRIDPTPYGEAVLEALEEMPRLYPQVRIIERQLMPEHFHFVVFVRERLPKPLGALIRGFKAGAAKRWKALAENGEAPDRPAPGTASGTVPAHSCAGSPGPVPGPVPDPVPRHSWRGLGRGLRWAEGFQDTIFSARR